MPSRNECNRSRAFVKAMLNKRITRDAAARFVALEPRAERDRHARSPTIMYICLHSVGVVALLQVDRSGVYPGVQAGAIVVAVQGEPSRALSDVGGGDGTLIGVAAGRAGSCGRMLRPVRRRLKSAADEPIGRAILDVGEVEPSRAGARQFSFIGRFARFGSAL